METSDVLAWSSGEAAWPVPLTENDTGPESVATEISPPASPVPLGENVIGTVSGPPLSTSAGSDDDGLPTVNCEEDELIPVTFTSSCAVRVSVWFELEPTVVVPKSAMEPLIGSVTGDPNARTWPSRAPM